VGTQSLIVALLVLVELAVQAVEEKVLVVLTEV
jgi:hypothetical protein